MPSVRCVGMNFPAAFANPYTSATAKKITVNVMIKTANENEKSKNKIAYCHAMDPDMEQDHA